MAADCWGYAIFGTEWSFCGVLGNPYFKIGENSPLLALVAIKQNCLVMLETTELLQVLPLEIWERITFYLKIWDILTLAQATKPFEDYITKQDTFLKRAFQEFLSDSSISGVKSILQEGCFDVELDNSPRLLKLKFPSLPSVKLTSSTLCQLQLLHQVRELQLQSTEAFQRAFMFQSNEQETEPGYKRKPPTSMKLQELVILQKDWEETFPLPVDYTLLLTKHSAQYWYNTYFGYMDNLWHGLHWGNTRSGALRLIHLNKENTQPEVPTVFLEIAGRFQVPTLSVLLDVSTKSTTYGQVFIKEGIQEPKWVDWSVTDFLVRISDFAREDWVEADLFTVIEHLFLNQSGIPESQISFDPY